MEERDMSADERTPGQQPAGHQQQPQTDENRNLSEQAQGGSASTGQASYGNSGDTGVATPGQNSEGVGRETDLSQSNQREAQSNNGLFSGSGNDMGANSAGTGRSGIEGSLDGSSQSETDVGGSTGRSGISGSLSETEEQDFADQGQGALNEDAMGSSEEQRTTDIETERAQGRTTDIEGSL